MDLISLSGPVRSVLKCQSSLSSSFMSVSMASLDVSLPVVPSEEPSKFRLLSSFHDQTPTLASKLPVPSITGFVLVPFFCRPKSFHATVRTLRLWPPDIVLTREKSLRE